MTQERLALVVRTATEAVMTERDSEMARSEITIIRTGVSFAVGASNAQVVVGRSRAGYHLGLSAHEPPGRELIVWGMALPSQAHVLAAAEAALDAWLEIMQMEF